MKDINDIIVTKSFIEQHKECSLNWDHQHIDEYERILARLIVNMR